ncbi:hypothetical protein FDECE_16904 [Fusarium decemcellulare]|nr:hypothetical protein FDECE_16904 [Fusarium decemcellulare]
MAQASPSIFNLDLTRFLGSPQLSTYTSDDENHHPSINELAARREIEERNSMVWNWLPDDPLDHEEFPEAEDLSRIQTSKEKQSDCGYWAPFEKATENRGLSNQVYFRNVGDLKQDDYRIIASNHNWGDAPRLYSILNTEERFQPESSQAAIERYGRMVDDTDSAASRASTRGTRRLSLPDPDNLKRGRADSGDQHPQGRDGLLAPVPTWSTELSPSSDSAIMPWGQRITPVGTPQAQIEPHNSASLASPQGPVSWSCLSSLTPATSPKSSVSPLAVGNAMNDRETQSDLLRSGSLDRSRTTRLCLYKGSWRDSGLGLESPSCSPSPETRYQAEAGYAATGYGNGENLGPGCFRSSMYTGGCPSPYSISDCDGSSHADLPIPNIGDVGDSIKPGPHENILEMQNTTEINNCHTQTATECDNNDSKGGEDVILRSDPRPGEDEPKPATRKGDLGIKIRAESEPQKDCEPLVQASVRTRRQVGFARVKIDILSLSWPLKAPPPEPSEDERSTDDGFDESEAAFQDLCEPEGNLTFQDQSLGDSGDSSSSSRDRNNNLHSNRVGGTGSGDKNDRRKRPRQKSPEKSSQRRESRFACPYQAYEPSQHCFRPGPRNPNGGCAGIQRLKCWKAFEMRDKATAHSAQSETCEVKEEPAGDRCMCLEDEGEIEKLGCSGSAEEIWWKIFRLVIPDMLGQTPEHLRCNYSPYYMRLNPSFMIPGLTFPNASFQPDQPNMLGSTLESFDYATQAVQSNHSNMDFGILSTTGPPSHTVYVPLLDAQQPLASTEPIQYSTGSQSGVLSLAPDSNQQTSTQTIHTLQSSESTTPTSGGALDQTQLRRNHERLKVRYSQAEMEIGELQEASRLARADLGRVDAIIDDLLDIESLSSAVYERLSEVSNIVLSAKRKLR